MLATSRRAIAFAPFALLFAALLGGCSTVGGGGSSTSPSNPGTETIAKVAGDNRTAAVGTGVATSVTIRITGPNGAAVSDVPVTFVPVDGVIPIGLFALVVNTDANGDAATAWILGAVGTNSMIASADDVSGSPVTFTATGTTTP